MAIGSLVQNVPTSGQAASTGQTEIVSIKAALVSSFPAFVSAGGADVCTLTGPQIDALSSGKQPLDATLTALAGLNTTAGLVEQTGTDAFTKRLIGVTNSTDIPTRALADARYAQLGGSTMTGVTLLPDGTKAAPAVGFSSDNDVGIYKATATDGLGLACNVIEQGSSASDTAVDYRFLDGSGKIVWTLRRRSNANGNIFELFRSVDNASLIRTSQTNSISFGYPADGFAGTVQFPAAPTVGGNALASTVSPTFTGTVDMSGATVTVPTIAGTADSDTSAASTAFVQAVAALKANLAGPTFTGVVDMATATSVSVPTIAGTADSDTSAASTAFVQAVAALKANLVSPSFTGTSNFTGAVVLPASTTIGSVDNTELGYLNGVTSNIQTQFTNLGLLQAGHAVIKGTTVTAPVSGVLGALTAFSVGNENGSHFTTSTAAGTMTVVNSGWYEISVTAKITSSTSQYVEISLGVNGAVDTYLALEHNISASQTRSFSGTTQMSLTATQVLSILAFYVGASITPESAILCARRIY